MATDFFGRAVNDGDTIWVPVKVNTVGANISVTFKNLDGSGTNLVVASGTTGQSTNPDEGDRPPH